MSSITLNELALWSTVIAGVVSVLGFIFSQEFRRFVLWLLSNKWFYALATTLTIFLTGALIGGYLNIKIPSLAAERSWPPQEGILENVRNRGYLRCGVEGTLDHFSLFSNDSELLMDTETQINYHTKATGFDADFCRVIAVAVFGDDRNERIRFIKSDDRFRYIQDGTVDVLVRNTTWTVGRDLLHGVRFGPTIFYDEQGLLTKHLDINAISDLNGISICVTQGTTTESNLNVALNRENVNAVIVGQTRDGVAIMQNDQLFTAFSKNNMCDVITADKSQLTILQSSLLEDTQVLDATLSKEPLAPAYIDGDEAWSNVVDYSIFSTVRAAEIGINRKNLDDYLGTQDQEIRQLLGLPDKDIEDDQYLGFKLGIDPKFVQNVIKHVGNYDEIYDNNLSTVIPQRGPNAIAHSEYLTKTTGGLMYAPPFTFPSENELLLSNAGSTTESSP